MSSSELNRDFSDLQVGRGVSDSFSSDSGEIRAAQAVLDALEDGVVTIASDGRILRANAAASEMFGHPVQALIGASVMTILPDWHPAFRFDDGVEIRELAAKSSDGDVFPVQVMGAIEPDIGVLRIRTLASRPARHDATRPGAGRVVSWLLNLETGIMTWDASAAAFFGYRADAPAPTWGEFLARIEGDDDQWFDDSLRELEEASEEVEFEFRFHRPAGGMVWVKTWAHRDRVGAASVIRGTAIDTTLMWEARSALFQTSQQYRAAVQASLDAFFLLEAVLDDDGNILDFTVMDVNQPSETLLNLAADDMIGKRMSEVLRPDIFQELFKTYRDVAESRRPVQEEVHIPIVDSKSVWIHHQVVPVGNGVAVKSRDITPDKQIQRQLRLTQFAVGNAAESMLILSEQGEILELNSTGMERLGIALAPDQPRHIWEIDTNQSQAGWPTYLKQLRASGRITTETRFTNADGTSMPVEVAAALFEFEGQTYICAFARDVSARQEAAIKVADLNRRLESAYDATLQGWSRALDMRDDETEFHSSRVTRDTLALAQRMGVPAEDLVHIRRGALLHDIGKMAIPDQILHKPGALTEAEWEIMRRHPVYAYEMLRPIEYLSEAIHIPYCHHEKWDGTGYPRGLKGEDIPLAARIFAIIDVFDALRSERPYRPAWPLDRVMAYIREQVGTHFDPTVAEAFFAMHEEPFRVAAAVSDNEPRRAPRRAANSTVQPGFGTAK